MSQTQDTQDPRTTELEAALGLAGLAVAVRALGIAVDQIEFERPVREWVETLSEGGASTDGAEERIRPGMAHTYGTLQSGEAIAIVHYAGLEAMRLLATTTGAPERYNCAFWELELPQAFEPDFRLWVGDAFNLMGSCDGSDDPLLMLREAAEAWQRVQHIVALKIVEFNWRAIRRLAEAILAYQEQQPPRPWPLTMVELGEEARQALLEVKSELLSREVRNP